jgi:hypothetical protein
MKTEKTNPMLIDARITIEDITPDKSENKICHSINMKIEAKGETKFDIQIKSEMKLDFLNNIDVVSVLNVIHNELRRRRYRERRFNPED